MATNDSTKPFWQRKWLKGMGVGAIIFFTVKGLIWLAIFFGAARLLGC